MRYRSDLHVVFVVGCQRSGTTLTGQILGAHPRAVLIDEDHGVYRLIEAILADQADLGRVLRRCLKSARRSYVDSSRFTRWGNLADSVTHLVLKAPNATSEFQRLRSHPVARASFVFVARDPRAVVCSLQRLREVPIVDNQLARLERHPSILQRFADDLSRLRAPEAPAVVRGALVWKIKTSLYKEFEKAPTRAILVRYEDLVHDPTVWIPRLLAHVGLAGHADAALRHERTFRGFGPGHTVRNRAIDEESLEAWRTLLTLDQQLAIQEIAADTMCELGYPCDLSCSPAPESVRGPLGAMGTQRRQHLTGQRW